MALPRKQWDRLSMLGTVTGLAINLNKIHEIVRYGV
jgi:hypothetical protein